MTSTLLHAENISVRRGGRIVLESCNLSVGPGGRIAIYGPNGAGKSTMLQALAGLLPLASGAVSFRGKALGQDVSLLEFHRRTAAVFQEPLLLRGTVRHNVELGLRLRGMAASERAARVQPWLDRLRISHLGDRPVGALSGGEAQRTSLARALVLEPEVFFLDEPFAALDAPTRTSLGEELADILDEQQIATLFVTHDIDEAADLCDHWRDMARVEWSSNSYDRPSARWGVRRVSDPAGANPPTGRSDRSDQPHSRADLRRPSTRQEALLVGLRRQPASNRGAIRSD